MVSCIQVLPQDVPSLYGSYPATMHGELQDSVPAPDLDKAEHRAAQQQAAAAALPRGSSFPVEHWRWALSVRHLPIIRLLTEV